MVPRLSVMCFLIGVSTAAQSQNCFPVVDGATQKLRDDDRREILDTELRSERALLAKVRAMFKNDATEERAAEISRHTENVNALQRELARIHSAPQAIAGPQRSVVKATHSTYKRSPPASSQASFWNPYNRASASDLSFDVSNASGRETP